MTKKIPDAAEATKEAFTKTQDFMTKGIASSEKAMQSMIEFNATAFKANEAIAKKMYEYSLANITAGFDTAKTLNKTSDVTEFYKAAAASATEATERMTEQAKSLTELSTKAMKETGDAGKVAYEKAFAVA